MVAWQIGTLEYTNNSDKIVKNVHWRCFDSKEANGELHTADTYGSVALNEITADAAGFISYSDLTEAKCLEWLYTKVNKTEIEEGIEESINEKVSPPVKSGTPW